MTEKNSVMDSTEEPERQIIKAGSLTAEGVVLRIDGELGTHESDMYGTFHTLPVILSETDKEDVPAVVNFSSIKLFNMIERNKEKLRKNQFRLCGVGIDFDREYYIKKVFSQLNLKE